MKYVKTSTFLLLLTFLGSSLFAQITTVYNSSTTWTVPANVNSIGVRIWGASGGLGGQDCGAGCTNAAASNVGFVSATFSVTPGNVIGIYPGRVGTTGTSAATNTGGGAGGISTYTTAYNGGRGGNAGPTGSSGGGGGGGSASVLTIAGTVRVVAAGAGGGGGMANQAGSGLPGSNTYVANGTSNTGGNGTSSTADGGGGGGGGGGHYGGAGGTIYNVTGETAGNGGRIGANLVVTPTSTTTNGNTAWVATGGRIEITYTITVPVTWLSFTAAKQQNGTVLLKWSTATESGAKDYVVQRSTNGTDWENLGTVNAAGNTQNESHYSFEDQAVNNVNYHYRLEQRDLDGVTSYSKIVTVRGSGNRLAGINPNPVINGSATLVLNHAAEVTIYNSTGAVLLRKKYAAGEHNLNLNNFRPGAYFLRAGEEKLSFIVK
ncbi:T9SS type A sorting domain-containing protein [Terrimonas rubra]|uniref:T9SS type A sorting domain-containing protein n=1 Tax=Terrimonas rubra TaxID=1035890 RepID=A0ABW6A5F3_9BACT